MPTAFAVGLLPPAAGTPRQPRGPVPPPKVLIIGDSMAASLGNGIATSTRFFFGTLEMPGSGLSSLGRYFGVDMINRGTINCGLTGGIFRLKNSAPVKPSGPCQLDDWQNGWPPYWLQAVKEYHPAVSIFLERLETVDHQIGGRWVHIGEAAYDAYAMSELQLAVSILTSAGGRVILMTSPYYSTGTDAQGRPWPEDSRARVDRWNAMLRQVAAADPKRVYLFDLNQLLDPGHRFARVIDGQTVRYADGVHLTPAGDCWLAPRILPYVLEALSSHSAPPQPVSAAAVAAAAARVPADVCPPPSDTGSPGPAPAS